INLLLYLIMARSNRSEQFYVLANMWRKFRWLIGLLLLLVAGVALREPTEKYFDIAKSLDIFATLFKEVNAYYVDEVDPEKLIREGIDGMLGSLDPYTDF